MGRAIPSAMQEDGRDQAGTHATVFGLDVVADVALPFLQGTAAKSTGRMLEMHVVSRDAAGFVQQDSSRLVCDQREADGSVSFRIDSSTAGFVISGPQYGAHLVSPDGRTVTCWPGSSSAHAWQRLLIAQVLPFAALLQGLEVFHASAVAIGDGAVALAGSSRAGKTSIALELCRRGASFLADDVIALERADDVLLAHPGTPVAGVDRAEARRISRGDASVLRDTVALNVREHLVRIRPAAAPVPLSALFFLDRSTELSGAPRFEPEVDPRRLLGASFNSVITTPARLRGLLEVCWVAAGLRVESVRSGPDIDAAQLAASIERSLGGMS